MINNRIINENSSIENSTQSERILGVVFLILWCQHTILNYVIQYLSYIPVLSIFSSFLIPAILTVLLLITCRDSLAKIKIADVLFFIITIIIGLISYFNPDNAQALDENLMIFLFTIFPYYFYGVILPSRISSIRVLYGSTFVDIMYYISVIGIIVSWAYQVYLISFSQGTYNQFTQGAVNVLPSVMFCIYIAFKKRKFVNIAIAIAGVFLLVVLGTRVALFSAVAMTCFCLLQKENKHLRIGVLAIFLSYFIFSNTITEYLINVITQKMTLSGFSVRVLEMLLSERLLDSSNRFVIYEKVMSLVLKKPILGYGLFGDRAFFSLSGSYSHNIVIEFFAHYGLFIGTGIAAALSIIYIKALKKSKTDADTFGLILSLICAVTIRLMLSQSYLMEREFFLLLGYCIGVIRTKDYRSIKEDDGNQIAT